MERTKTNTEVIRWKKTGGGSFRIGKRIIKPGQIFSAKESEIPKAFRDMIIPVDAAALKAVKEQESVKVPELEYTVRGKGGAWYDVVNKDGKVLNDKSLRKEQAEELVESLKG